MSQTMSGKIFRFGSSLFCFQSLPKKSLLCNASVIHMQSAGIQLYYPKEPLDTSDWPEDRKLRVMERQPDFRDVKQVKMCKMITLMRGPEQVHNQLIYGGFGVKALLGGRLMTRHFDAIRFHVNKRLDTSRMFALWRVDQPWQPLSKRGAGKKLGGGKGSIHHYCTPVRAERIIVELGGDVHPIEATKILAPVSEMLPFPSRVVSQKDLEKEKENEEYVEKNNRNPFTMEYIIRNNMGGAQNIISPYDYKWFGKYK